MYMYMYMSHYVSLSPLLASTGLVCSAYGMLRNLFAVACLIPFGYAAFTSLENVRYILFC